MTESDIIRLVRQIIREELTGISMGSVVSNESQTRTTAQRNATEGQIPNMRNIQPFGVSSRAPAGTPALIVPIDSNATHVNTVGHFDEGRPTGADGETLIYNAFGQLIHLKSGKILIGSKAASENLVLGQIFKTFAAQFLQLVAEHTHSAPGYPPTNKADFLSLKASPIQDEAILSDENFTEKGG